jgi:hypothetical protein
MNLFKTIISSLILCIAASANAFDARAKPIQVIMPFPPGGGVDQTFRHMQKYASQKGITLIGIYKPGAEGLIAMSDLVLQPKDGYHVTLTTVAGIGYFRTRSPSTDIIPITGIRDTMLSVVSSTKSNYKNFDEFEKALKLNPDLTIGIASPSQKLFVEQLLEVTKSKNEPLLVPYKGSAPLVNDLIAGHVQTAVVPYSVTRQHINSGKLNLLALTSREKLADASITNIATRYPKWEHTDGFVFAVADGTSKEIIDKWTDFLKEYTSDPQVQKEFLAESTSPTEFGRKNIEKTISVSIKRLQNAK